jgi:hypothetical protein
MNQSKTADLEGSSGEPKFTSNLKDSTKEITFNKEFLSLITQARETIEAKYGTFTGIGNVNVALLCLNRYSAIYKNPSSKPRSHYTYFETIYNRNRSAILNTLESDDWIRKGKIVIQFGEGVKGMEEECRNIKIMLSYIYQIAHELKTKELELSKEMGDDYISETAKDQIRCNILLLHLMRIFYILIGSSSDQEKLAKIISKLEDDLGIDPEYKFLSGNGSVPSDKNFSQSNPTNSEAPSGLGDLFQSVTKIMGNLGLNLPPDVKMPSEKDISKVLGEQINNPQISQLLSTVTGLLNSNPSLKNSMGEGGFNLNNIDGILKNIVTPETLKVLKEGIEKSGINIPQSVPQPPPGETK